MLRLVAGTIGWIGLGIILAEVVNNLNLFSYRLALLHAMLPAAVYLSFEIALKRVRSQRHGKAGSGPARIELIYHWVVGLVGVAFLVSLPFLWWEVIKKLAGSYP